LKTIYVDPLEINLKDYVKRPAIDNDFTHLIKEDSTLIDSKTRGIIAVYLTLPKEEVAQMREVVRRVENFLRNRRTGGLTTNSKIFGYMPREQIRKDYCSSSALAREQPKHHAIIANFGANLARYYKQYAPEKFEFHDNLAKTKILSDWVIKGSPFTSGIINKNTQLNYHFDSGNFKDVYSNQLSFKDHCKGGYLCMPKYDLALEVEDGTLCFFDGQKILHGVTPFEIVRQGGFRLTLVYYTLKQMWICEDVTKEIDRIRKRKSEREMNRLRYIRGELNFCQHCMTWTIPNGELCSKCNKKYGKKKSMNVNRFKELGIDTKWIGTPFTRLPEDVQKKLVNYKR